MGAHEKPRVLVVDDSRVMRKAIERILAPEFELAEAEDGEAGWQALRADRDIQAVISDVQMPRLDGYSLICRIRADDEPHIRDIPVIVITGAEDDITRERAYACGANDFITKPIDPTQLLTCLRGYSHPDWAAGGPEEGAALGEQAHHVDPLTQLLSRRRFFELGNQLLAGTDKNRGSLALIRLDVDDFAGIRTRHGDEVTDRLLIWLAKILMAKTRRDDMLARIASAEFAILTLASSRVEAAVLCERLRSAVSAEPFAFPGGSVPVTASLGLVVKGHDPGEVLEDLLALADQRVRTARAGGGNRLATGDNDARRFEEAIIERPTLDEALKMLANNEGGRLVPYAPDLAASTIPLLEFCNQSLGLDLDFEIEALKQKLNGMK